MPSIPTRRLAPTAHIAFKAALTARMTTAAATVSGIIVASAGADGRISPSEAETIVRRVTPVIRSIFIDDTGRAIDSNGRPRGPYAALLLATIADLVAKTLEAHRSYMRVRLPSDITAWLTQANATVPDDTPVSWVDPAGLILADRILRVGVEAQTRATALLRDGIRAGMVASGLAALFAQWFIPGRARVRRPTVSGVDGSYGAMRLARTEIARAANVANVAAAKTNPYTSALEIYRALGSDPCALCDAHATFNVHGDRVRPAHLIGYQPLPQYHPNCVCSAVAVTLRNEADVERTLRAKIAAGDAPPVTPLANTFTVAATPI